MYCHRNVDAATLRIVVTNQNPYGELLLIPLVFTDWLLLMKDFACPFGHWEIK